MYNKSPLFAQVALHLANIMCQALPVFRFYSLRARLYRAGGLDIGARVKINGTVRIFGPNVHISEGTWIGPDTVLIPTVDHPIHIGRDCDIAPRVTLACGSHVIAGAAKRAGEGSASGPIDIGDGSWVGANVTFIAGSSVGTGCVVAAGAVVTKKFGPNLLIGGVPAKVLRSLQ